MTASLVDVIVARAAAVGESIDEALAESLARYVALLARWNRRINLTAFNLDRPDAAAIDRLVIEALRAARHVPAGPLTVVDIGSGGGSPAIPLNLVRPDLQMTLVEARARKSAFLREAGRALGLTHLLVETQSFEAFCSMTVLRGHVDLVTMRAVRPDEALWSGVYELLRPGGRMLWFIDIGEITENKISNIAIAEYCEPVLILEKR